MSDEPHGNGGSDPLHLIPDFHRTTRMPLDAVVRLHFEGTVAYQNGFAANVSALGMYVKHPEPPPVGTRLVFEFVLGEERKPVQGAGVVAWVREKYDGPGRPAGVGITFTELDALSRQHIAEALFEYLEAQLGVDVADHPDVPDLLAAVPQRSDAGLGIEPDEPAPALLAPTPDAAPQPPAEPATFAARASAPALPSFQLFEEPAVDAEVAAIPPERLFAAEVPPDDATGSGYGTRAGAASPERRPVSLAAIAIALLVALGGFAAWWYLMGPGSVADAPLASVDTAPEPAAPAEPPRPALDPAPGPGETLAETVGAEEPVVDPAAPSPEAGAAAAESAVTTAPPPAPDTSPAPAASAEPPLAAPVEPATLEPLRLADVVWDSSPGSTVVSLVGSAPFRQGGYRFYDMPGERPRLLVKLLGVAAGHPRSTIAVGTEELSGVRLGFHEKPAGNEQHVVFDLAAPGVRVAAVELADGRVVVRLSRGE